MGKVPENVAVFLWYWLWAVPSIGLLTVVWGTLDPSAFERCPHVAFVFPLIGLAAGGWTWLRTFDHRYLPQVLYSTLLLIVGVGVFWSWL